MQIRFTPELKLFLDSKRIRQGDVVSFSVLSHDKKNGYNINLFGKSLSVKSDTPLIPGEKYKALIDKVSDTIVLRLIRNVSTSRSNYYDSLSILFKLLVSHELELSSPVVSFLNTVFSNGSIDIFELNVILAYIKKGIVPNKDNIQKLMDKLKKYFSVAVNHKKDNSTAKAYIPALSYDSVRDIISVLNSLSMPDSSFWAVPISVSWDKRPAKMAYVKKKNQEYYIIDIGTDYGKCFFAIFLQPSRKIQASLPKIMLDKYGDEIASLKKDLLKAGYSSLFYQSEDYIFIDGNFLSRDDVSTLDIKV